ncbi:MAG: uroporphyrinogen-III C-methyltransferase [Bryobacterales bacterium]|jgi:uroporphyrin-III C-methyltransferase|nr:uroporphyrinogen-III C-methyltransferase [Bryobacterales bacterium]
MTRVYLVGAGPGDPDLLTVKAARLLASADVILYDRLVSMEILALARPGAELVYVGKEDGCAQETQRRIFAELAMNALRGRTVVRLKGGDPMVFGRGAEEWAYLSRLGVAVEVVPGISSAVAVPALASIPLTARGVARSFAVTTGHAKDGEAQDWRAFREVDTLVILMGVKHRANIAATLMGHGRPPGEPCAFIENGSTPRERVVLATLADVAAGAVEVASPAIWVCGRVVALRAQLLAGAPPTALLELPLPSVTERTLSVAAGPGEPAPCAPALVFPSRKH